jgi:hypothetical protein
MRIESGSTKERKVRTALFVVLCAGMGGWFAYDGWIGYPEKNRREHIGALPFENRAEAADAKIYSSVTAESLAQAKKARNKVDIASQRKALAELYGGPPSFEDDQVWYYFGPTYRVKVVLKDNKPQRVVGVSAEKSSGEIHTQRWLSACLGLVAVILLSLLVRVWRTHLVLDDQGLSFGRRRSIAWADMKSLKTGRFLKKGWLDLVYKADGAERRIRLDEYHLAQFDEVIAAICTEKNFEDPVVAEKAQKRAQADSPPS